MGIKKLEMFFLYQEYGFNQYSNIILQFDGLSIFDTALFDTAYDTNKRYATYI